MESAARYSPPAFLTRRILAPTLTLGALLAFTLNLRLIGLWSGLALGLAVAAVALTVRFHVRSRHLPASAKG